MKPFSRLVFVSALSGFSVLPLAAQDARAKSATLAVAAMDKAIADKEIAGSVTLVAGKEGVIFSSTNGFSDLEKKTPMAKDAMFWIASMTKPVTGTAVMMMQDAGKLSVDDPVSKYIPAFKDLKDKDGKPVTVTIKQCLTHSSGLSEVSPEESGDIASLEALMPLIVAKPVMFEPGSQWQYCQTSINTAARVVEVVSGESFPEFLEKHLFGPLGMKDTTFYPDEKQASRIATSYKRTDAGELEKAGLMFLGNKPITSKERYPRANGGLFSTAEDYAKFARMILNGGELDGKRYLSETAVKQMTTVQSGDLKTGFTPGNGWGLGWCVVREPQGVTAAVSPGTFGHGGAYGTQAWIDPVKGRAYVMLVQRANFPNSDGSEVRKAFQDAAAGL
ncbi:beta-lactamase family protein [Luteolibacter sp. GHJ8]|uniref:Beta-lactamase family protein n=1 Tax=Luteolibacter rhizosphaerae TaxID=2989719 RepID=A0ABT3G9K3_9BACT|nr:serine hydrolase domain-containing protein [Luteolibacter rhizosphaerae]MCW1916154.1 beta-lactamase family protein [Luteolibacter rhizosphaerae]